MVANSSSTISRRVVEGVARSAEEARIPLLDEEEKGGSGGGVSETSSRNRRDGTQEDTGTGTRGFAHVRDGGSARRGQETEHDSVHTCFDVILNYSSANFFIIYFTRELFPPAAVVCVKQDDIPTCSTSIHKDRDF